MKPSPDIAMQNLISEIKVKLPFNLPKDQMCSDTCKGCSKKLLDYLYIEISDWEIKLDNGETPSIGELNKLVRLASIVQNTLIKNKLIKP